MESIQLTYNDIELMTENSDTYQDMNSTEKSDFLVEFINRYNIGGEIMKTYMEVKESILKDPTTHYSLKDMINRLENTDIIDNYYDVKVLLDLCILRLKDNNIRIKGINDTLLINRGL